MILIAYPLFVIFIAIVVMAFIKKSEYNNQLKQKEEKKKIATEYYKTYNIPKEEPLFHDIDNQTIVSNIPIELTSHERYIADILINNGYFLPQFVFVDNYFRTKSGKTSQIDIIAVGKRGVFVIESKDYNGWIMGDGRYDRWRQSFPNKYFYFYNPVKQNINHINVLKNIIGEQKYTSMIIFGEKAKLKDITHIPESTLVIASYRIKDALMDIYNNQPELLSAEQITEICRKINFARIKPDDELRNEHIKQIKDELGSDRVYS